MNGIIFCICSTSAISVPPIVLKWCRKERKKVQVKKDSHQNQSRWWIWSRDTAQGIQTCLLRQHQKNPEKTRSESQIPLSSWTEPPPRTVKLVMGASSSDYSEWNIDEKVVFSRVEIWWNVGSKNGGDPWVDNSSPRTQTSFSSMTMIWTLTRPQNRTFR